MTRFLAATTALSLLAGAAHASGQTEYSATLAGHAILPAETLMPAPQDAPKALQSSGKFAPLRRDGQPGTGPALPLSGQPVQGFSGISRIGDGRYYVLTDNGFGTKANSPDAMLFFHILAPDWQSGKVVVEKTTFLSDPNHVVPFSIAMEGSDSRYLTGADFDIEGFQVIDGKIYVGDEFGPWILVADVETGIVESLHATFVDGTEVKSPDHPTVRAPNPDGAGSTANLKRSRGYEGLAKSVDGTKLYPLLEGPLWDAEAQDYERVAGNEALRLLEWDVASRDWTGRSLFYRLEQDGNAIGDFNMIDETRGLVIERDGGQGHPDRACAANQTQGCFAKPATFKRVYMIDMKGVPQGGAVHKLGYIDLMNIQDPEGLARVDTVRDGVLSFPFVTIEDVERVDADHIIVGNDNNFPFSKGRDPVALDNNEFVLLKVTEFLNASAQ